MKTVIIGLDALDPRFLETLYEKGKLPHFTKLMDMGGYSRFNISNPPQSEVSWTSIATGLNPGGHGLFDFVHRNPKSYNLIVSLLPMKKKLGGIQFVRPYKATTIFDFAVKQGFPATTLWWPATFPAKPESPVHTLPGLGTPDIQGKLGVGALYTNETNLGERVGKTPVYILKTTSSGSYQQHLRGPLRKNDNNEDNALLRFDLQILEDKTAIISIGKQRYKIKLGEWSPIISASFKISRFASVQIVSRAILTSIEPSVRLYLLPLQIHPLHPLWRYGTPQSFVRKAWNTEKFLTIGWPQDTTALEDGCISDKQFLKLCEDIYETRKKIFFSNLTNFHEGILASVFDSLDRIQHMFWSSRPDIIESWYMKFDVLLGETENIISKRAIVNPRIVIVSDHGFTQFDYKVHLNKWLLQKGYLITENPDNAGDFKDVVWDKTKAYAIGLNSLYLNLQDREKSGTVAQQGKTSLLEKLVKELGEWKTPNGTTIIQHVLQNKDAFSGSFAKHGPDLVIGYAPGFRASQQTGLGGWGSQSIEQNTDHWNADHCIDSDAVPGVLLSNQGLSHFPNPSYQDFPAIAIDSELDQVNSSPPTDQTIDDDKIVEERLKSLGYL